MFKLPIKGIQQSYQKKKSPKIILAELVLRPLISDYKQVYSGQVIYRHIIIESPYHLLFHPLQRGR